MRLVEHRAEWGVASGGPLFTFRVKLKLREVEIAGFALYM